MKIAPCYLPCHQDNEHAGAHYHCSCGMIVFRKSNFERHLMRQAHSAAIKAKLDKKKATIKTEQVAMDTSDDHVTEFPCFTPADNEDLSDDEQTDMRPSKTTSKLLKVSKSSPKKKKNSEPSEVSGSPTKKSKDSDFKELNIKLPKDVQCQVIVLITPTDKNEDKLKMIAEGLNGGVTF